MLISDTTYASFLDKLVKSCSRSTLKSLNEQILFPLRYQYLIKILTPYLQDSHRVLDLGSSNGKLAAKIQSELAEQQKSVKFTGCDVRIQSKTYIPIIQYDGCCLPFADNHFDCVLIVDVLHHTKNMSKVIQEAKRVSSKYVLIKDHYWENPKDFTRLKVADYVGNNPYGINLPYNFLTQNDWINLLQNECGLSIIDFKTFKFNLLDPCKHILFKVKV